MKVMNELRKKSGIAFFGMIINKIIVVIAGITYGNLLGADIYGQVTYIISFLSIFSAISLLGLRQGLSGLIPKYNDEDIDKKNSIVSFAIIITILLGITIVVLLFVFKNSIITTFIRESKYEPIYIFLIPSVFILAFNNLLLGYFQSTKKINVVVNANNIILPLSKLILFCLFFVVLGKNIQSMIIPYYLSIFISLVYMLLFLKKDNYRVTFGKQYKDEYKDIIKFSLPLLLSGIIMTLMHNLDIYMVGYFMDSSSVGIYKMALNFGAIGAFSLQAINSILPAMVRNLYVNNNIKELKSIYQTSTKWLLLLNLLVLIIVICLKNEIMYMAGAEYVVGAYALFYVTIGQLINVAVGAVSTMNAMTGHPKYNLYTNALVLIINVILNFTLIPIWGIEGAAIATAISVACVNILRLILFYRNTGILPYNKSFMKIIIPLSVSFVAGLFLKSIVNTNNILTFLIVGSGISIVYVVGVFTIMMNKKQKDNIVKYVKKFFKMN